MSFFLSNNSLLIATNPLDGTWTNTKENKNIHKIIISNNATSIEVERNCAEVSNKNCSWGIKSLSKNQQLYTANYSNKKVKRVFKLKLLNGELLVKYDIQRKGETAKQKQFRFKRVNSSNYKEPLMKEMEKNNNSDRGNNSNKSNNSSGNNSNNSGNIFNPNSFGVETMKPTKGNSNSHTIDTNGNGGSSNATGTLQSDEYQIGGAQTIEETIDGGIENPNVMTIDPNAIQIGPGDKIPSKEKIPMETIRIDPRSLRIWVNYLSVPQVGWPDRSKIGPVGTITKIEITPPKSIENIPWIDGSKRFITIVAEEIGSGPPKYHSLYLMNDADKRTARKAQSIYKRLSSSFVDQINGFPQIIESKIGDQFRSKLGGFLEKKCKLLPPFEVFYLSAKGKPIQVSDLHSPSECLSFDPYKMDKRTSGNGAEFGINFGNYHFASGYNNGNNLGFSKWAIYWFDTEQARDNAVRMIQHEGFTKACYHFEERYDYFYELPDFKLSK